MAGGPLYAAAGRAQAAAESGWIGAIAMAGIVLVLLLALRRWQALLALVPVAVGLLAGTVACVAVFGSIHALTLVIGASLIGVAVDFPMHWLGKSYGMPDWRAWPALRRVLPGLTISLAASLVGYVALAFTPFPALTQTAVFSAGGSRTKAPVISMASQATSDVAAVVSDAEVSESLSSPQAATPVAVASVRAMAVRVRATSRFSGSTASY